MAEQNIKNKKLLDTSFLVIFATLLFPIIRTSFTVTTFAEESIAIKFENPTTQPFKFIGVKEKLGVQFVEEPPKEIEPKSTQGFSVSPEDGATQYYFQVRYGVVSNSEIIGVVFFGSDWNSLSCEPVGEGPLSGCGTDTIIFTLDQCK